MKPASRSKSANHIAVFQEASIRRVWHNEAWWFSVVDVCAILTASPDAGAYWRKLKQRLNAEAGQPVTFCHGLKLQAPDGKQRVTDCANTEGLFRLIQSIPSPKAEQSQLPASAHRTRQPPARCQGAQRQRSVKVKSNKA
jgi:DNA-damage-inducible protein D